MPKPLMFRGPRAFSERRLATLRRELQQAAPALDLRRIEAVFVYLLEARARPPKAIMDKATSLLGADGAFRLRGGFFVTPRKGTISPWSSKATDIFHNCGLDGIDRVERGVHLRLFASNGQEIAPERLGRLIDLLHDRMTEGVYTDVSDLFKHMAPAPCVVVPVLEQGSEALRKANVDMGLALSEDEINYLYESYRAIRRNPTDVELVMFGQVNSEHCRHKIFNADWIVDGEKKDQSLFNMIRNTHRCHPGGTRVAYRDNAAVIDGTEEEWFEASADDDHAYGYARDAMDMILKVETHNHPTAISPYPGAATGSGGEIRDETATGIGGRSKAGLCAFMVSNLRVPGFAMPWEKDFAEFPARLATPLQIMTEGPLGAARFGNEFGRPQLAGLFRTFETRHNGRYRGYHKPIMAAGGMGNIKRRHTLKKALPPGALVLQIGGPAMRIGLGGGAASSMATGTNAAELDFNSVQRDNAEMERRCQQVVETCIALGDENPILSIHDIGAGGLSNGCPELVAEVGGEFWLRKIPNEDRSMSPMEIWCCEAQERYVLSIPPEALDRFLAICARERCPVAAIGRATGDGHLSLDDAQFGNKPIDVNLGVILGRPPRMLRDVRRLAEPHAPLDLAAARPDEAAYRVLRLPAVADKTFLITIADRSVTGLVARDQMVGPWQTPVADLAVTATSFRTEHGEAMAMGERTSLALVSAPASGRMAVGEALTNIAAADIGVIGNVKLSANWMCACGEAGEDANLYDTVKAVGLELCPRLGVSIPVGKDSLSMRSVWDTAGGREKMTAPLSLIVSAFAPVRNVRRTLTPDLKAGASRLLLVDLGLGRNRLGASALAQVYGQVGGDVPDVDDPALLARFFAAVQELVARELLLAYHDRSDGGLFTTLAEMAMAGRRGVDVTLDGLGGDALSILFAEELGAVLQVADDRVADVRAVLASHGLAETAHELGGVTAEPVLRASFGGAVVLEETIQRLHRAWSELTYHMQARRDDPGCALEEHENLLDETDPGMTFRLTYDPGEAPAVSTARPRMAILREQGINGHVEMAAAFDRAGFESHDVHMTDLFAGRVTLDAFAGLVACGGFSYGDVLGAGSGWAGSILFSERLLEQFTRFFARPDTIALGVCNGCQMMSQLKSIIPGAGDWPAFTRNRSEQFEARYATVEVCPSPSVFFRGMAGSRLPIPVAHGEGLANFSATGSLAALKAGGLIAAHFVDNSGRPTERYPFNPNGSPEGVTSMTTPDGRATILMPHPERLFRAVQMSYRPAGLFSGEDGPWMRMFRNARAFVRTA